MDTYRFSIVYPDAFSWRAGPNAVFIDQRFDEMRNVELRYWYSIGLLTAVLAAAIWIIFSYVVPDHYPKILPVFLAIVAFFTAAGQVLLTWALKQDPKKFNSWYLIYKTVKMLIIMTIMLIYVMANRKNGIYFLAGVFVIYLAYMLFETGALNQAARRESKE